MLWILLNIWALLLILNCHERVTLTICLKSYLNLLAFFYKLRSRAQPQVLLSCIHSYCMKLRSIFMLILVSLILKSLLFLITNCCALLKIVQYEHLLWTCTNDNWHYHYHYFMSVMCSVSCMNVITVVLLYQMSSKTIFMRIMSFMFMVLGLMTGYICTLLIHRLV